MGMPQAIERQAAEAEELQGKLYGGQAPVTKVTQPAPEDPPAESVESVEIVEQPQPPEPAAPAAGEDAAYWKKRFETVQGKLNAEQPKLYQTIQDKDETIRKLLAEAQTPVTPAPAQPDALVTQSDIDAFGEDLIDAMRRTAQEEARKAYAAERTALEKRFGAVETRVGQVGQQVEQTAVDSFWGEVVKLVPDWLDVDATPAWVAWLDTTPEFADVTYRELATRAIQKGNASKVAKLVSTWKAETTQAPAPAAAPTPPRTAASALERQVAPSSVRSNPSPAAQKLYTRAEYEALYDVRNVQRYGDKQAAAMIAEADLAVAENRVRWT